MWSYREFHEKLYSKFCAFLLLNFLLCSDVYSIFTLQDTQFLIPFPDEDFAPEKKIQHKQRLQQTSSRLEP